VENPWAPTKDRVHLQVQDVICHTCNVQPTSARDSVCELCKAIGKQAVIKEPEKGLYSEIRFAAACAKRFIFGIGA
jgi:hypothetical protein